MLNVKIFDSTLRDGSHAVKQQLKKDDIVSYCDDRITKDGANVFDVVKELWQEVQELKQDLASYQEYVGSDAE